MLYDHYRYDGLLEEFREPAAYAVLSFCATYPEFKDRFEAELIEGKLPENWGETIPPNLYETNSHKLKTTAKIFKTPVWKVALKRFLPEDEKGMAPLFAAIGHGCCQAGREVETWREVYRPRVNRVNENYASQKLRLFGPELAAPSAWGDSAEAHFTQNTTAVCKTVLLNANMPDHGKPEVAQRGRVGLVDQILSLLETSAAVAGEDHGTVGLAVPLPQAGAHRDERVIQKTAAVVFLCFFEPLEKLRDHLGEEQVPLTLDGYPIRLAAVVAHVVGIDGCIEIREQPGGRHHVTHDPGGVGLHGDRHQIKDQAHLLHAGCRLPVGGQFEGRLGIGAIDPVPGLTETVFDGSNGGEVFVDAVAIGGADLVVEPPGILNQGIQAALLAGKLGSHLFLGDTLGSEQGSVEIGEFLVDSDGLAVSAP